ncbi:hypothetical protein [Massilia sp. CCM 8734]|uniref:hypothetical protein n=1 Tax=Massilia sp. CCM 8734 TaxID=2609283 RepID=UPI00141F5CF2|nr:hypothetical protein [Massilia sp. CCM 8734]NHZ96621.1 hypothetical protein [Massilia sp. CCM 8734]
MKNILILLSLATGLVSHASAADKEPWEAPYKPLKGEYLVYSGTLGERQPPTRNDSKVSIRVEGKVAKDLFDAMHPDEKNKCTAEPGYRERNKDGVSCFYYPGSGYACYFGFDLRTGKSIGGASC